MTQLRKVADGLRARFTQAAVLLEEAAEDILAYRHLPLEHQRQLHSTDVIDKSFLREWLLLGGGPRLRPPVGGALGVRAPFPLQCPAFTVA